MEVGIVGLQSVGKTTLFDALTGAGGSAPRGGPAAPGVGMAKVPDARLEVIAHHIPTQQLVPATVRVVDIPGFGVGGEGSGFARQVLAHIREVDAILHVVKCFEPGNDAAEDIDSMETELIFADLALAESARDKAAKTARSGDRDAKDRLSALERVLPALNEGRGIRSVADDLSPDEATALRGYGMLTSKPVLYIANIAESDIGGASPGFLGAQKRASEVHGQAIAVCAKLEAEFAELEPADQAEMLESLGLEEPALSLVAREVYSLLGLTSFYTAGEKEVRAWPIPFGAPAPVAAGSIHSDIQRGFIRAECYHVDDLVAHKTEKAIREAGRLRSEGKGYAMQDGDVVHFLFNV